MLVRKPAGIVLNEHTDEDGAPVFRGDLVLCTQQLAQDRAPSGQRSPPVRIDSTAINIYRTS
jgi:hypothetical protein